MTRRAVLTHSPTLHAAQSRGLDQTLAKSRARLGELQARLGRGRTRQLQFPRIGGHLPGVLRRLESSTG